MQLFLVRGKKLNEKKLLTFLSLYHSNEILLDCYASQVICAYFIASAPAWHEWFSQSPNGAEGGDYAAVTLAFACGTGGGNGKHKGNLSQEYCRCYSRLGGGGRAWEQLSIYHPFFQSVKFPEWRDSICLHLNQRG